MQGVAKTSGNLPMATLFPRASLEIKFSHVGLLPESLIFSFWQPEQERGPVANFGKSLILATKPAPKAENRQKNQEKSCHLAKYLQNDNSYISKLHYVNRPIHCVPKSAVTGNRPASGP
jgi:hypothetical protein